MREKMGWLRWSDVLTVVFIIGVFIYQATFLHAEQEKQNLTEAKNIEEGLVGLR